LEGVPEKPELHGKYHGWDVQGRNIIAALAAECSKREQKRGVIKPSPASYRPVG